jgi:ubiquinone/menaquinone biosynthesis C-methylase UbiE
LASTLVAAVHDLITMGVERDVFGPRRRELLASARGRVLDVGAGLGANLPHFPSDPNQISDIVLLDPSPGMLERAGRKATQLGMHDAATAAQAIPFSQAARD